MLEFAIVDFWELLGLSSKKFHHLAQQLKMRWGGIFRTLSKLRHFLANFHYTEVMLGTKKKSF